MNDETDDDLSTQLTRLLRTIDGVHTVYATKPLIPSLVGAVVEAVRNDPVGMHLITVTTTDDGVEIDACIGVSADESASVTCRRAHDAMRAYIEENSVDASTIIRVNVGRVG